MGVETACLGSKAHDVAGHATEARVFVPPSCNPNAICDLGHWLMWLVHVVASPAQRPILPVRSGPGEREQQKSRKKGGYFHSLVAKGRISPAGEPTSVARRRADDCIIVFTTKLFSKKCVACGAVVSYTRGRQTVGKKKRISKPSWAW